MKIVVLTGPMCSGKSQVLISKFLSVETDKVAMKPAMDSRNQGVIYSRYYGNEITIQATDLTDIDDFERFTENLSLREGGYLFVDEAHFFATSNMRDAERFVRCLEDVHGKGVNVYVSALDYFHNGDKWPVFEALKSSTKTDIVKLTAFCSVDGCDDKGTRTLLDLRDTSEKVHVGDVGEYQPMCENHWNYYRQLQKNRELVVQQNKEKKVSVCV